MQKMNRKILEELADKISTGVATEEEIVRYNRWYRNVQKGEARWIPEELGEKEDIDRRLFSDIEAELRAAERSRIFKGPSRSKIAVAVLLLMAAGSLYWFFTKNDSPKAEDLLVIRDDVNPGRDRAVLTLGDGTKIILDEAEAGLLANEGYISVDKPEEGVVTYQADQPDETRPEEEITYHTISTPVGGKYKIVLPDATEVWLNSMSSIRFPTRFSGGIREVEVTGEVFFDVTRQPENPFLVHTGAQVIRVLGTQFNVEAYSDESQIRTTLIEGSVLVKNEAEEVKIEPGQQVLNHPGTRLRISEADIDQVTAWKNDLFHFWNTDLKEIMKRLSRWYGVEVEYLNEEPAATFTGFISRDVTIANVLYMLEEAGSVKFGLEENKVFVKTGIENENVNDKN